MKCPNPKCGAENPSDSIFCVNCGSRLSKSESAINNTEFCKKCGAQLKSGAAFCGKCGASINAVTPVSARLDEPSMPHISAEYTDQVRAVPFGEAIGNFFSHYADFKGRATRCEYFKIILFNLLVYLFLSLIAAFSVELAAILLIVYFIAILIPTMSIICRRLHDVGRSGGYYFFVLIPIVGAILVLVWLFTESDGDNMYGPRKTLKQYNLTHSSR